jgi:protein involved in polysaccharide export with SLBB domain
MLMIKRIMLIAVFTALGFAQNFGPRAVPGDETGQETDQMASFGSEKFALEQVIDPVKYILAPGDEIGLNIQTAINQTLSLTITPTGDLFIPAVGVCHLAGYTLAQGSTVVSEYVLKNAFPNAQVHMVLVYPRKFLIQVSGAVSRPGFVEITPLTRLDEVIFKTEGFHQLAKEHEILIHRNSGEEDAVNFHDYLLTGNLAANPVFLEGDRIEVPFGDLDKNGIVVRGSVSGAGYDIISDEETLGHYIKRKVIFNKNSDLDNVTLSRETSSVLTQLTVNPKDFDNTELLAGDVINFMYERGVTVTGFVQAPGGFAYYPGYSVSDYIALAGGNAVNGNPGATRVSHLDGSVDKGDGVIVMSGDIIFVPRTMKDIFIGDMSILAVVTAFVTIYLTFLSIS